MSARTELFGRWLQGSVVIEDQGKSTGRRYFVHAGTGTDTTGYGSAPGTPFASLAYAVTQCTAGRHDIIYVMEGHTETILTTIEPLASTRIVGLGSGAARPQLTPDLDTEPALHLDNASVVLENLCFEASPGTAGAPLAAVQIAASQCVVRGCHFDMDATDLEAILVTDLGHYAIIEDCRVRVLGDGPDAWIEFDDPVFMPIIRRNVVVGSDGTDAFDVGIIDFGGEAVEAALVYENIFDGAEVATVSIADALAVIGPTFVNNVHSGLAANNDTVVSAEEVVVTRAPAALPQTDSAAIFNVNGHVLLKRIVGVVTSAIGNVANETKLVSSPAGAGIDTDICAVLDIDDDALDTIYTITGTFANAMVDSVNLPRAASVDINVLLPPGSIDVDCAGSDGGGGRVRWSAVYVPLEEGASVTAA